MTRQRSHVLIGVPVQTGASQPGCLMGPDAFRTAGLGEALESLGHQVTDKGNVTVPARPATDHPNPALRNLSEMIEWTRVLSEVAYAESADGKTPIFLGGDHSMAAGTVAGIARRRAEEGKPLFILWLDAHPDYHDLMSTESGNLHGVPVGYFTGRPGFKGVFPPLEVAVEPSHICMMGLRSVDPAEHQGLIASDITVHDMRQIDEFGVAPLIRKFIDDVQKADGTVHISLDVDFLDPGIAPAVGTTVPGGATFREAHLIMELMADSGLVSSLDLVELNPFMDERGRTATLMVDLAASLFGRKVMDRPTKSF
ncbi:arginase [Rhodobacteraceae bacterium NNCM2]|nr:arginase [Coraliihabitans acroporae]